MHAGLCYKSFDGLPLIGSVMLMVMLGFGLLSDVGFDPTSLGLMHAVMLSCEMIDTDAISSGYELHETRTTLRRR